MPEIHWKCKFRASYLASDEILTNWIGKFGKLQESQIKLIELVTLTTSKHHLDTLWCCCCFSILFLVEYATSIRLVGRVRNYGPFACIINWVIQLCTVWQNGKKLMFYGPIPKQKMCSKMCFSSKKYLPNNFMTFSIRKLNCNDCLMVIRGVHSSGWWLGLVMFHEQNFSESWFHHLSQTWNPWLIIFSVYHDLEWKTC